MQAKKIRFKFLKEYRGKLEILKEKLKNSDEAYRLNKNDKKNYIKN